MLTTLFLSAALAGADTVRPAPQDTADFVRATPEETGMDGRRLGALVRRIRAGEMGRITSLLVVRDDRLVVEEYFDGEGPDRARTMQSVTKSITALLAGIPVVEGRMSVDSPVVSFFPEYRPPANPDPRKDAIRIEDLLTMRTGLAWTGDGARRLGEAADPLRFVLDLPMAGAPGEAWRYVNPTTLLLGAAVGRAAGTRIDSLAAERLFAPLGARRYSWAQGRPRGLPDAAGGLFLRPRDVAKVGVLLLDGGRWRGRQVLPEAWVATVTRPHVVRARGFGRRAVDYGYLWYVASLDDPLSPRRETGDVYVAAGALGQWIFVVPKHRLVMVVTAQEPGPAAGAPFDFLFTDVLRSIR